MILGLTGGYCTGKNTVASLLEKRGWTCIDVDLIGHEALLASKEQIVKRFGIGIVGIDGQIDRKALASLVFADPEALADHEAIVHPRMFDLVDQRIEEIAAEAYQTGMAPLICLNAAILYKMPQLARCAAVIEVRASMAARIRRGEGRDGLYASDVRKRIAGQAALWKLRSRSRNRTIYLNNSSDIAELRDRLTVCLGKVRNATAENSIFSSDTADKDKRNPAGGAGNRTMHPDSMEKTRMAGENKKFLWIALSLCVFVLILVAAGLLLFNPRGNTGDTPASAANTAAPKATDPQDFLVTPPPAPTDSTGTTNSGDVIVVYGNPMEPTSTTVQRSTNLPGNPSSTTATTLARNVTPATTTTTAAPVKLTPIMPSPDDPIVAAEASGTTTTTVRKATPKPAVKPAVKPAYKPVAKPVVKAVAKPVTTTVPKTTANTVEDGIAWIQTGSFSFRTGADSLRDSFTSAGISSVIMVKDIDGKSWYQVRVGPFSGKDQAREWLTRVKAVPGASKASWVTSD